MIEATGLSKRYGSTLAVSDLSFSVHEGLVTGFLGPNGAGKSTTMRLMLGLDRGAGRTTFGGRTYGELRHPLREVGTLLEAKAYHPTRWASSHLRMLAAGNDIPRRRVDEVLELVGLQDAARTKRPKKFSLGMGQRLGLAAALLGEPRVLLLDEPSNGLDPAGINWLRGFLRSYAAGGRAVFVSSHLLAEMAQMADHLVVIGKGQLLADTPTAEFVRQSTHTSVVVRSPQVDRLAALLAAEGAAVERADSGEISVTGMDQAAVGELAFANGVVLHELSLRVATLEQAFLEATREAQEFQTEQTFPKGGH
jgi:ABC-2 type transport system ATP-binding protein